jgi:hypothetical protein
MQNLNDNDKQRVGKLLEEIYMSLTDKIKNLEKASHSIEEKMASFQPKLLSHLKNKCKKEYDWIEKNTKYTEIGGEVKLDVAEDMRDIANDNLKAFENCSSANDFGVKNYFEKVETENFAFQKNNESCLSTCIEDIATKSNDQMKTCFHTCFNDYFTQTEQTIRGVIGAVNEFEKRI